MLKKVANIGFWTLWIPQTSPLQLFREPSSLHKMSDRQTLSKRFGAPQTSPNTHGTKELLIKSSRERPLKPFNSRDLSRKDRLQLIWKFLLTIFAIILLVVSLWGFSRLGLLSKWEQRPFNMLSILLSGIASLGVGSLLGHLGSMLRWPLLARTRCRMQDVW